MQQKTVFLFEQQHSHFLFSYHAREKVLLYVFPLSFVCWLIRISGLSGPSCLMANLSSNFNLSNVFFNRVNSVNSRCNTTRHVCRKMKDTGGIIRDKTTVLEYDHGADYFTTIRASYSADCNSYCSLQGYARNIWRDEVAELPCPNIA